MTSAIGVENRINWRYMLFSTYFQGESSCQHAYNGIQSAYVFVLGDSITKSSKERIASHEH